MYVSEISAGRYTRLIQSAKARVNVVGYAETHHIVPRSKGGTNGASNLVRLTAREHFLAHWLLFRMYRDPATARAFKLMLQSQGRTRGRDYAAARQCMSEAMRGCHNVAKRPEVAAKISAALQAFHPYRGNKRPGHSKAMRDKGLLVGSKNMWFGTGARQRGEKNHMATPVAGVHKTGMYMQWPTLSVAAEVLGVSLQAVSQALRHNQRSRGWIFERL